jgi:hypothetical protein
MMTTLDRASATADRDAVAIVGVAIAIGEVLVREWDEASVQGVEVASQSCLLFLESSFVPAVPHRSTSRGHGYNPSPPGCT